MAFLKKQTILIAMDGGKDSEWAFEWYCGNMHRPGNNVIIVSCSQMTDRLAAVSAGKAGNTDVIKGFIENEKMKMSDDFVKYQSMLRNAMIVGKIITSCHSSPGHVIISTSVHQEASMIIMGLRGYNTGSHPLGSVCNFVVSHSLIPVIVCKYPDSFGNILNICDSDDIERDTICNPSFRIVEPRNRRWNIHTSMENAKDERDIENQNRCVPEIYCKEPIPDGLKSPSSVLVNNSKDDLIEKTSHNSNVIGQSNPISKSNEILDSVPAINYTMEADSHGHTSPDEINNNSVHVENSPHSRAQSQNNSRQDMCENFASADGGTDITVESSDGAQKYTNLQLDDYSVAGCELMDKAVIKSDSIEADVPTGQEDANSRNSGDLEVVGIKENLDVAEEVVDDGQPNHVRSERNLDENDPRKIKSGDNDMDGDVANDGVGEVVGDYGSNNSQSENDIVENDPSIMEADDNDTDGDVGGNVLQVKDSDGEPAYNTVESSVETISDGANNDGVKVKLTYKSVG
ncbi:uncharacterized protein DDB_G0290685 [Patella vulgata]|uniref:uncharacterized protein DDB_G0290685 n=1 Tax=Patella vulgata TaxID=6465 RepID=UPI00218014FD|nr:uncharacterized protein DDB_G0290685 [Patella vulgata]